MLNYLFAALAMFISLASFNYSYVLSGVNRAFYGCFKALAESSVLVYDPEGMEQIPYFEPTLFERYSYLYFDEAIKGYVKQYNLGFSYANDPLVNPNGKYSEASLLFSCQITVSKSFSKSARFLIKEGTHE